MKAHHILVQLRAGEQADLIVPENLDSGLQWRLQALNPFINLAKREFERLGHNECRFAVQLHDEEPEERSFRFDAPLVDMEVGQLIPDPYALGSQGFWSIRKDVYPNLPNWRERLPIAIWRGASTGRENLKPETIETLPRYRLCQFSRQRPDLLDARLSNLVQMENPEVHHEMRKQLLEQGLLRPRLLPHNLALHRWLIEIDGNVNSWGLLWKLLCGSCILRVESTRRQWYHHQLVEWKHVIPVSANLNDLEEKLIWCKNNVGQCEEIAVEGRKLALNVVWNMELDQLKAIEQYAEQNL